MKNQIKISILGPDGESEDSNQTEMLAGMLKGKSLQFEFTKELVAEIVFKVTEHFKDPVDEIEIPCHGIVSAFDEAIHHEATARHKILIFPGN